MPAEYTEGLQMLHRAADLNLIEVHFKQTVKDINAWHIENLYVLDSSAIFILFTCKIPVVTMYFQSQYKTVWILIIWLCQNPADLDL